MYVIIQDNLMAASYFGQEPVIRLYDLRYDSRFMYQQKIINDHYEKLRLTLSQNGKFIAFPSQCGTIRVFEFDNLNPVVDYKTDAVGEERFIPSVQFNDDFILYNTKNEIVKRGII